MHDGGGSFYPREGVPLPTVEEEGWAPGPVWTGVEKIKPLTSIGF